jgi:hypothetical protein
MHKVRELFEVTPVERALQPVRECADDRRGSSQRLRSATRHCERRDTSENTAADRNASRHR